MPSVTCLQTGPGVENVRVGDTVGILRCDVGVKTWGTLAEKTVVAAASLAPVPAGWTPEEMAAAPLTFLTAWQALTQWSDPPAPPRAGSVLLVTGASGGVGVASLLLGKVDGARGCGAVAKRRPSGKRCWNSARTSYSIPQDPDLKKKFKAAAPKPVDLAVDNVAGPLFNQVVAMMGYDGRISVVGRSGGAVPEFNTGTLFFRRLRVGGVAVGDYTPAQAQDAWKEILAQARSDRPEAGGGRGVHVRTCEAGLPPARRRTDGQGAGKDVNRAEMYRRLHGHAGPWDMIVVGGGASGVGVAVDAASRGYEVLLLEQSDFGKGTSSRSTKLVHGGVRYLEQGNISLVMEALKERGILLAECSPPGSESRLRGAELRLVGGSVLRNRPQALRHAGRQVRLRPIANSIPRRDAGAPAHHPHRRPARRSDLFRRPVRRFPSAHRSGGDGV